MNKNESYHNLTLSDTVFYQLIGRDGEYREESEPVLKEHLINVRVNEQLTMKLICTPQFLSELILGRLLTEGMICSVNDVKQIYICETGSEASILLKNSSDLAADAQIHPVTPIPWKASHVFALADCFQEDMPLHKQTRSTHLCFLAQEGKLIFRCEDIGRHNALDKAIGYALLHGIDLTGCMVCSSGRIPTDMVIKAIRARIPVLVSKAAPSREAVNLAEQYALTLICAARQDRMKLFAGTPPVS